MDVTTSLKALLSAIQQLRDGRTEQNAARLRSRVEEVLGLQCDQLLASAEGLPSECVTRLLELAGDPNSSAPLTSCIVALLGRLELLHTRYNVSSTLASVIHHHSATPGDPLVLQSLQLLQKLTYHHRLLKSTNYIPELLSFLMTNIQAHSDDIVMPCLGLMANLCRDNPSVQSHIKSVEDVKPFYRTLINFLAHNSLTVVVFTLSILASLTLNDKVGEKLFDAKNIHQTFQLVFNIIVNGDGTLTRKYSVDLLVDLLKSPKIADYLSRYQHFPACVSQVLGLLQSKDPDSGGKVLELLLAMSRVSGLRSQLCEVVFRPVGLKLREGGRRQASESGLCLVQWLSARGDSAESCSQQALQLLKELLEEALSTASVSEAVLNFVQMLLPVLLGLLTAVDPLQSEAQLTTHCLRVTLVAGLLLLLCAEDSTRALVSLQVDAQLCLSQVESLLSCCHSNGPLNCPPAGSTSDVSQVSAEALLRVLEVMSKLRQQVKDMETSFYKTLQDQRMVTPLSLALTSHHRGRVLSGLAVLFEATALPDFPALVLGESMAANNSYRWREEERTGTQEVPPPGPLDTSWSSSRSAQSLVERIQNGLELQEFTRDSHVSDIIDVYEQKISAFKAKESRLQDLLEAKALALSQADRLIAQYRLQRAQAEAEACQLGSLVKEAERRRAELKAELRGQVLEVERSKADMEELLQHNNKLQRDSEEHQALKGAYNALLSRLGDTEWMLKELQAAHAGLNNHNEALRRNQETLQQQLHTLTSALQDRDEEVRSLQADVQKRNSDITDLRGELRTQEEKVRQEEERRRQLEETSDVLRKELSKMEQSRKDISIKVSSLELQKSHLETKLKQKDEELNKHSAMISMIHSLSSGKMKSDVNLSL
ncbi:protein CIP2A isoform X2 [Antennarius striatus]|uniref:protein CIP2A isoform X2 n=1 Tax=Antennarius striatus TaxID=241820 RepID=UPI0035B29270